MAMAPSLETSRGSIEADPYERFLLNKNFSALNGVRCICCLAVIKVHLQWEGAGPRLFNLGFVGVDLFFMISGFLIVTLLIRERERRGSVSLAKFYARRTLRIFPILACPPKAGPVLMGIVPLAESQGATHAKTTRT
jgi:hypothetical protein